MIAAQHHAPLKKHVWTLILLNTTDGILTFFGISAGLITEGNPLLSSFSAGTILAIKVLLSICLSGFLFTSFIAIQSHLWRYFFISTNTLYSLIFLLHIFWISLLAI